MRLGSRRLDWRVIWNPDQKQLRLEFGSLVLFLREGEARHLADRIHDTLDTQENS